MVPNCPSSFYWATVAGERIRETVNSADEGSWVKFEYEEGNLVVFVGLRDR